MLLNKLAMSRSVVSSSSFRIHSFHEKIVMLEEAGEMELQRIAMNICVQVSRDVFISLG